VLRLLEAALPGSPSTRPSLPLFSSFLPGVLSVSVRCIYLPIYLFLSPSRVPRYPTRAHTFHVTRADSPLWFQHALSVWL